MTHQPTRWFEYGEPVGAGDRVEAAVRTTYETGPNEADVRTPDVERGTVAIDALDLLEDEAIAEHAHTDGRVQLSALPAGAEERLLGTFERSAWDRLEELVRDHDISNAAAVDHVATEARGLSQSEWARRRGVGQQAVSDAVARAREHLESRADD